MDSWKVVDGHHLEREFQFKNFKDALAFTNQVGALAEVANHHPDIYLSYGKVRIQLWTHQKNALSEKDYALAAQIDQIR